MNAEKNIQKRQRNDESFKRAAVEHWLSNGQAAKTVAAELGVNVRGLRPWQQRFGLVPASRGEVRTLEAAEAENRR